MADKLPVIYVYNHSVEEMKKPHVGKFSIDVTPFESRRASVAYAPDVEHCSTCNSYAVLSSFSSEETKCICRAAHVQPRYVPSDGSGFCHEHSPLEPWKL